METTNEKRAPLSSQVMEPQEMLKHLQAVMTKVRDHEAVAESQGEWELAEGYSQEAAALERAIKVFEVLASPKFIGLENNSDLAYSVLLSIPSGKDGWTHIMHHGTMSALLKAHESLYPKSTPLPKEGDTQ